LAGNEKEKYNNLKTEKKFALMGVAGYIAPRHLKAIKNSGNTMVACVDPFDSVGLLTVISLNAHISISLSFLTGILQNFKVPDKE
jgi:UDP-N-acetyl-2-amino-2-deoxyglucuronate dehydrogenase